LTGSSAPGPHWGLHHQTPVIGSRSAPWNPPPFTNPDTLSPRPPTGLKALDPTGEFRSPDFPELVSPSLVCMTNTTVPIMNGPEASRALKPPTRMVLPPSEHNGVSVDALSFGGKRIRQNLITSFGRRPQSSSIFLNKTKHIHNSFELSCIERGRCENVIPFSELKNVQSNSVRGEIALAGLRYSSFIFARRQQQFAILHVLVQGFDSHISLTADRWSGTLI